MLILITGGSGNEKSELAEYTSVSAGGKLTYIATMRPWCDKGRKRIKEHGMQRDCKGFKRYSATPI